MTASAGPAEQASTLARILVLLIGLGNLAFGLVALAAPTRIALFIGLEAIETSALGELRAVFGGLVLVLGALVLSALRHPDGRAWLQAVGLVFLGLSLGRVLSLVLDGFETYTLLALLLESVSAAILILSAPRIRASAAS